VDVRGPDDGLVEVSHGGIFMFAKQNCVYVSSEMKSELKQLFFTEKFQTIAFMFLVAHEKAHIHYR
jgi:hypothetical protein